MNDFVNPQHRGVNLPPGCKDLMDVLKANVAAGETPIYALHSKRAPLLERHVQGLSEVGTFLNLLLTSQSQKSFLSFILTSGRFFALTRSHKALHVYVSFGGEDSAFEGTLREIFAEAAVIPVAKSYSPVKGPEAYCFEIPMGGTDLLELVTKVLRASGVSGKDPLTFLFRE
jgi:hypothetical protein